MAHALTYFVRPATAAAEGGATTDTRIHALTYAETLRTSLLPHFARHRIHIVGKATSRVSHYRYPVDHCSPFGSLLALDGGNTRQFLTVSSTIQLPAEMLIAVKIFEEFHWCGISLKPAQKPLFHTFICLLQNQLKIRV